MSARFAAGAVQASSAYLLVGSLAGVSAGLARYPVFGGQALRYAGAAVILLTADRLRLRRRVRLSGATGASRDHARAARGDWALILLLACTGLAGFNFCLTEAVTRASPAAVGTIVGAMPVVLAISAPLASRHRPAPRLITAGILVSAGTGIVAGQGSSSPPGVLLALGALACEVAFTLLAVPLLAKLGPLRVAGYACIVAAPVLLAAGLIVNQAGAVPVPTLGEAASIGYLTVAVTAGGFVLIYSAVAQLGAARTGLFAGLVPFGAIASALVLGTGRPRPADLAGAILVAAGVVTGLSTSALGGGHRQYRRTARRRMNSAGPLPPRHPTSLGYRDGRLPASLDGELAPVGSAQAQGQSMIDGLAVDVDAAGMAVCTADAAQPGRDRPECAGAEG